MVLRIGQQRRPGVAVSSQSGFTSDRASTHLTALMSVSVNEDIVY